MEIELLHIEGCPSWIEAGRHVSKALREAGHETTPLRYRLIRTECRSVAVQDSARALGRARISRGALPRSRPHTFERLQPT